MSAEKQREPLIYESRHWIEAEKAAGEYRRDERTIRRWVADGRVRRIQPAETVWLYRPDLAECESASKARRRGS